MAKQGPSSSRHAHNNDYHSPSPFSRYNDSPLQSPEGSEEEDIDCPLSREIMRAPIAAGLEKLLSLPSYDGRTDPDDHVNNVNKKSHQMQTLPYDIEERSLDMVHERGSPICHFLGRPNRPVSKTFYRFSETLEDGSHLGSYFPSTRRISSRLYREVQQGSYAGRNNRRHKEILAHTRPSSSHRLRQSYGN
ncbi:hypothetical protein QL285_014501 [Trifolium repens]|nr:hypothetical protein QL285_014501 [Trifolium repens]